MASLATTANSPYMLPPENVILGQSEAMKAVCLKLERVAATNLPVLIQGESGTGKELIARFIHQRSPLQAGPFLKVSCPGIAGTPLEAELFGGETGTPAEGVATEPGETHGAAQRGTLFLDEIAELDSTLQAKLLQLLQDGQLSRVTVQGNKIEARIVCSTNRNLQDEIGSGNFRQDLFYRINILQISVPSLRDRKEDIPIIANYLLDLYNEKYNCQARRLSNQVVRMLQDYHWPGNIRELENLIKRYVILGSEDAITTELLSREQAYFKPDIPLDGAVSLKKVTRQAVRELERQVILRSLQANNWNRKRVARALSISYRALLYKIRDAGLSSGRGAKRAAAAGGENDQAA
jgi:two-component system, NtrC family, response regulator AtoC